jgi:hypothetical protein
MMIENIKNMKKTSWMEREREREREREKLQDSNLHQ